MYFKIAIIVGIVAAACPTVKAQEASPLYPEIFWSSNGEKGALVVSTKEMLIIGPAGEKFGQINTGEHAYGVYLSPDGKKVAYATSKGLWLAKLDTRESYLVKEGDCGSLHWNKDSNGFLFVISKKEGDSFVLNLYWSDGDGKNLRQVYP